MAILNVSVMCLSRKTIILTWNIVCVSETDHSFRYFFEHSIQPRLPSTSIESWIKAEEGTSKDKLDLVDLSLVIGPVVESFKYSAWYR